MGAFEHFPYTNFHDLNLNWIIQELQKLTVSVQDFISINAIKYADPIQWYLTRMATRIFPYSRFPLAYPWIEQNIGLISAISPHFGRMSSLLLLFLMKGITLRQALHGSLTRLCG